jgi:7,8-dihydroneopterin aldolase/epimerase/oxygenase
MVSKIQWPVSTLVLNGLRQSVRLGCEAEERQVPQFVRFDVKVRFESLPLACMTDDLKDTVCYAELGERIKKICQMTEYRLIERLGWDTFQELKTLLPSGALLWLKIHKERPPIPYENEGSSFVLGDELENFQ